MKITDIDCIDRLHKLDAVLLVASFAVDTDIDRKYIASVLFSISNDLENILNQIEELQEIK